MEKKGGCCLATYGGGGKASSAWEMGRILLKFRPIAPKPAAMAMAPSPPPPPSAATVVAAGAGRGKRKAGSLAGGRRGRKPKKAMTVGTEGGEKVEKEKSSSSSPSSSSGTTSVDSPLPAAAPTTLPFMPEEEVREARVVVSEAQQPQVVAPRPVRPAASWVTVEDVTCRWRDDGEAPAAAIGDEAPAFVSDRWGRVTWTNAAFNWAVAGEHAEVRVGLAAKGDVPVWGTCVGFTCRVRVRYARSPHGGGRGSLIAPCDVWRLDGGGYVWRLDLQAALSLGLP